MSGSARAGPAAARELGITQPALTKAMRRLEETESGRIGPLDVPGATWRRAAGVMTRKGVEPNPAAAALSRTIEQVCARVSAGAGSA